MSVPPSFFIHFLLKKKKVFCFVFLSFSSLVRLFVCVFVYSFVVVLFALHVLLLYSRTDAIHFKRFY